MKKKWCEKKKNRACGSARVWPGQGACHNTNFISWLGGGGGGGGAFVSQYSCDTTTVRHDTTLWDTTRCARMALVLGVSRYNL